MPFLQKIETKTGIIGIWEIRETVEELASEMEFSSLESIEFNHLKFERRKKEYLATRLILSRINSKKLEIGYFDTGQPYLLNSRLNISISHSANLVAVFLSEQFAGIDVEQVTRNVDKVANRFMTPAELTEIIGCGDEQTGKIIYWGAKESIFKCTRKKGIQFNSQIHISRFKVETSGSFYGTLTHAENTEYFQLWYFAIKNNMVVYCVEINKTQKNESNS